MNDNLSPIELVVRAAELLGDLCKEVTFVGGVVVGLLTTEEGLRPPRPTKDVDLVVEIYGRIAYYEFEQRLLSLGFTLDPRGPVCRYLHGVLTVDVLPTDADVLGFSNRWYPLVVQTSDQRVLLNGLS